MASRPRIRPADFSMGLPWTISNSLRTQLYAIPARCSLVTCFSRQPLPLELVAR